MKIRDEFTLDDILKVMQESPDLTAASITAQPGMAEHLFFQAVRRGSEPSADRLVRLLLDHHVNVNTLDEQGWSGLHHAAYNNDPDMVQLLRAYGADTTLRTPADARHKNGQIAEEIAKENGYNVAALLLRQGTSA